MYQYCVLTHMPLGEIINFLFMFYFEEKLISQRACCKPCQSDHPLCHGKIVPTKVGMTVAS